MVMVMMIRMLRLKMIFFDDLYLKMIMVIIMMMRMIIAVKL